MNCAICQRELSVADDPFSVDCGGDCLLCMAEAGDPECMQAVVDEVRKRSVPLPNGGSTCNKDEN